MADRIREREIRGVKRTEAGAYKKLRTETRTILEFVLDSFEDANIVAVVIAFGTIALAIAIPGALHLWVPFGIPFLVLWHVNRRARMLPLRMPIGAKQIDLGDPKPGYGGYNEARGLVLIGYDIETGNRQVWSNRSDETGHILVLGKTGAGKTEGLMSRIANYHAMGSGSVFVDAKGDRKAAFQFVGLSRMFGAEDDVLILDFVTGGESITGRRRGRSSNTTNPIASGSADGNFQLMSSFLPPAEGENAVFVGRALALMRSLMAALVDMRDKGHLLLGFGVLANSLSLEAMKKIWEDPKLGASGRAALESYLRDLPGFNMQKFQEGKPQEAATLTQHGYGQAYYANALGSFGGTYSHIFFANLGEVDFFDVVARKRKLLILLPPLEKSPAEMKTLGKINLALLKEVFARSLGPAVEGEFDKVVENRPASSKTPFPVILDEYAYIATEGIGVIPAQARGLGISVVFAGQDWGGFEAGDKTAAQQIWGSTTLKMFGVVEDPETIDRVVKKFSHEAVSERQEMRLEEGRYKADTVRWDKRAPVTETDLQRQTEGMVHFTAFGELFRLKLFYANPPMPKEIVINRFLAVGDLEKQWHLHGKERRRQSFSSAAIGIDAPGQPAAAEVAGHKPSYEPIRKPPPQSVVSRLPERRDEMRSVRERARPGVGMEDFEAEAARIRAERAAIEAERMRREARRKAEEEMDADGRRDEMRSVRERARPGVGMEDFEAEAARVRAERSAIEAERMRREARRKAEEAMDADGRREEASRGAEARKAKDMRGFAGLTDEPMVSIPREPAKPEKPVTPASHAPLGSSGITADEVGEASPSDPEAIPAFDEPAGDRRASSLSSGLGWGGDDDDDDIDDVLDDDDDDSLDDHVVESLGVGSDLDAMLMGTMSGAMMAAGRRAAALTGDLMYEGDDYLKGVIQDNLERGIQRLQAIPPPWDAVRMAKQVDLETLFERCQSRLGRVEDSGRA